MSTKLPWTKSSIKDGFQEIKLRSWNNFHEFLNSELLQARTYIWRGQRNANWQLLSTLDRVLWAKAPKTLIERRVGSRLNSPLRERHLEEFKLAVRGRRGVNPQRELSENEWWALGQHFGLATPLLDWTTSPFTAAFFAFAPIGDPQSSRRAIWALATQATLERSKYVLAKHGSAKPASVVELVRPMSDENPRLVSQGGLFTRAPDGIPLDDWVKTSFAGPFNLRALIKFTIPNADRADFLRSLNRMNINHLSLFPDLVGASEHSNLSLTIKNY